MGLIDTQHRSDLLGRAHHRGHASDDAGRPIIRLEPGAAAGLDVRSRSGGGRNGAKAAKRLRARRSVTFLLMTQPVAPWTGSNAISIREQIENSNYRNLV